ncbi:hypothetical protein ACLOJK_016907 [Asimina triloba]
MSLNGRIDLKDSMNFCLYKIFWYVWNAKDGYPNSDARFAWVTTKPTKNFNKYLHAGTPFTWTALIFGSPTAQLVLSAGSPSCHPNKPHPTLLVMMKMFKLPKSSNPNPTPHLQRALEMKQIREAGKESCLQQPLSVEEVGSLGTEAEMKVVNLVGTAAL